MSINNYQGAHCHFFAAQLYTVLNYNDIKCKYCILYGFYVDNYDEHIGETLDHCYVKVGKYYYDSKGKNTLADIKEREAARMEGEEKTECFYYTIREHSNKIKEDYLIQPSIPPYDFDELCKDVDNFILEHNLIPNKVPPQYP